MAVILELGNDTVEVSYSATPFMQGYTSGPPEHCYPDEGGEIEIEAVRYRTKGKAFVGGKWILADVMVDVIGLCTDNDIERFQEEIASIEENDEP